MSNLISVGQYKSICVLRDRLQVLVGGCGGEGGGQFEKKDQNWVKKKFSTGSCRNKIEQVLSSIQVLFMIYKTLLPKLWPNPPKLV